MCKLDNACPDERIERNKRALGVAGSPFYICAIFITHPDFEPAGFGLTTSTSVRTPRNVSDNTYQSRNCM